jgi:16S rRNA (guanine527-N7)-methyltransferase
VYISDREIVEVLAGYGATVDATFCERLRAYASLLLSWNKKVSLTSVTDPHEILRFHFGESAFAASIAPIRNGRLADVGSGAGFPGLPLAMISPDLRVALIESNLKKAAFLAEVIRAIPIPNAKVIRSRMEDAGSQIGELDFLTARAVGGHEEFLKWSISRLSARGKVILWVSRPDAERLSKIADWKWSSPTPIPHSRDRSIVVGAPVR